MHTSISAFGQDGPKAAWPATDLTVLASSGSLVLNGDRDRPPVRLVVPRAFAHGLGRRRLRHADRPGRAGPSGRGQHVDVAAQTAAMLASQVSVVAWASRTQKVMEALGTIMELADYCSA